MKYGDASSFLKKYQEGIPKEEFESLIIIFPYLQRTCSSMQNLMKKQKNMRGNL